MDYTSYITDLHLNLHPEQLDQLDAWYEHCKRVSDFFTIAYYPYHMVDCAGGFRAEAEIDAELMQEQWRIIQDYLAKCSRRDGFVSFLGYEWQGAGEDGDHNVYFKDDHAPILLPKRYSELVESFKGQDVIAIPHHLAYSLGNRGKNWETHDEAFSPLAEIYSHHGSSECDLTELPMNRHIHMGPRVDETSVDAGLKRGNHFGLIASGDNHEVPAMVKNGRAGVWARECTKDAIWEALLARRTFGFTGSKISVWTELDGNDMGSIVRSPNEAARYSVDVTANSRVARIELYRDGDLWDVRAFRPLSVPKGDGDVRIKFRIECGWGPNVRYFPEFTRKVWNGSLRTSGKVISVEPVFSSFENAYEVENAQEVTFRALSQKMDGNRWMRDGEMRTEGFIFELEGPLSSHVALDIEGERREYAFRELLEGTSLIVYEKEAKRLMRERCGITEFDRSDSWYHNAYKVRVCKASLAEEYEVTAEFEVPVEEDEHGYHARVVQADGQTAWGSPIWVSRV